MAISVVQSISGSGSTNGSSITQTLNFATPTMAGNCVILAYGGYNGFQSNGVVATTKLGGSADNWHEANSMFRNISGAACCKSFISYDDDCLSSSSLTIAWAFSTNQFGALYWANAWEVTGFGGNAEVDATDQFSSGALGTWQTGGSGGVPTSSANEFWVFAVEGQGTPTGSGGPGWSSTTISGAKGEYGYQIVLSTGTAYASGSTSNPYQNAACLATFKIGGGGVTTITDTDASNTSNDAVVQQTMSAADNPAAPASDTPGPAAFADTESGHGTDAAALTAHPSASDASQTAEDDEGNQTIIPVTQETFGATVETPRTGPADSDTGQATTEGVLVDATLSDTDAAVALTEIGGAADATLVSTDQSQAAAVETGSVQTNVKSDGDTGGLDDEPGAIAGTLADTEVSSASFDVGARFPFTDTESVTGNDAVVAYGSVTTDTDTAQGVDAGGFGTVFRDTDTDASVVESTKLVIRDSEAVQSDEEPVPAPAVLSDSEVSHTAVDVGFASFDGTSRVSVSQNVNWNVIHRECKKTGNRVTWSTLLRKKSCTTLQWGVIQRRSHAYRIWFDLLTRARANNSPVLRWNDYGSGLKLATVKWDTVARIMGDRGHFFWNTIHRITDQPAKLIKWNVATMYPVRVQGPTDLFKWNTLKRLSDTPVVEWNTEATATRKSKTPVQVRWDTVGRKSKTATLTEWNVSAPTTRVTKTTLVEWNTIQRKTNSAAVSKWNTDARLVSSTSMSWKTLQRHSKTPADMDWGVLQRKLKTATVTWETLSRAHSTGTAKWNTIGRTGIATCSLGWNVNQRLIGRPCSLHWDTNQRLTKTPLVEWNVYNPVSKTPVLVKWNTTQRKVKDDIGLFDWVTLQRKVEGVLIDWRTKERYAKSATLAKWNVLEKQHTSAIVEWSIQPRVRVHCTIGWGVVQRRHVTFYNVRWETLNNVTVRATLEWNIGPKVQGLIKNAPAAPWQSAYPSR